MAYVNVLEWKAEQVAEWLQGLDDSIYLYAHYFINNNVTGTGLLNITVDDLYKLHVEKLGHQEIILEGLEHLRNLHHNLDTENLQYVCLKLSCKARSLYNELRLYGPSPNEPKQKISTSAMSAAADVLDALWTLILWLDRPPFNGQQHYNEFKSKFIKIGVELATSSQRDTFAEKPVNVVKECCEALSNLSDMLIQQVSDSIILQPAYLDIATVRRKTEDENFGILFDQSSPSGVHIISEVKFQSPAHQCGRIHSGDEIVQINYQTVVGWHVKKVTQLMNENPTELILTLKKRPKHLPVFGQIYIKPFRIPARKNEKSFYFNNLPSPRAELLVAPNINIPLNKQASIKDQVDSGRLTHISTEATKCDAACVTTNDDDDDDQELVGEQDLEDECFEQTNHSGEFNESQTSVGGKSPTHSMRSVLSRPRSAPQRRATISGSSPSNFKPYINITEIWSHIPKSLASDGGSAASTLKSSDSGRGTIEGPLLTEVDEIIRRNESQPPRPLTYGGHYLDFSDPDYVSVFCQKPPSFPPPPVPCSTPPLPAPPVCEIEYVNLDADVGDLSMKKQPVPKPRSQVTKDEHQPSPGRKKPIPQPRQKSTSTLSTSTSHSSTKSIIPERTKEVCPVPTPQFKSFKKISEPKTPSLPDYVNTTPPPPPSHPPPPLEPRGIPRRSSSGSSLLSRVKTKDIELPSRARPNHEQSSIRARAVFDSASPSRSTPYYMSEIQRDSPSRELTRRSSHSLLPNPTPVESEYVQCDPVIIPPKASTPPPPIPERLYDLPHQPRTPKSNLGKKT